MKRIALNFKLLRKQKKVTQKKMSKDLGLTPHQITSYESGQSTPPLENAIKIADYFGVSLDMFCKADLSKPQETLSQIHDKSTMRAYLSGVFSSFEDSKLKLDAIMKALE